MNKLGFTLIEYLIYLAIGSLILLAILGSSVYVSNSQKLSFKSYNLSSTSYKIHNEITRTAHSSIDIKTDSDSITLITNDNKITYYLDNSNLLRLDTNSGEITQLNPNQIKVISFYPINRTPPSADPEKEPLPIFDIQLQLENHTPGIPVSKHESKTTLSIRKPS